MTKEQIAKSIDPVYPFVYAPTTEATKLTFNDNTIKIGYFEFTEDSRRLEAENKYTFIEFGNALNYRTSRNKKYITLIDGTSLVAVEYPAQSTQYRSLDESKMEVEDETILTIPNAVKASFDPTKINIDTKTPSLDILIDRIAHDEIELNTENYFQRESDLWDAEKQSRLIESILIRFPLPAFYFDGTTSSKWLIIDGLQRLSSIRNFVVKKELKLTNLEFLVYLEGKGYDDLDRDLQRLIRETQVVIYVISPSTPNDVKFNIFKRINTGGLILEPQEIRHALFQGKPAKLVAELAKLPEFISATNGAIKTNRMLDRDFANRFLAFYHLGYQNYVPDLDTFMSKAMSAVYRMTPQQMTEISQSFKKSMILNEYIFGKHAFRKFNDLNSNKKPINKALFDVFSVTLAKITNKTEAKLREKKDEFIDAFVNLLYNDYENKFFWAITSSTSDQNRVTYRFFKVEELISEISK